MRSFSPPCKVEHNWVRQDVFYRRTLATGSICANCGLTDSDVKKADDQYSRQSSSRATAREKAANSGGQWRKGGRNSDGKERLYSVFGGTFCVLEDD